MMDKPSTSGHQNKEAESGAGADTHRPPGPILVSSRQAREVVAAGVGSMISAAPDLFASRHLARSAAGLAARADEPQTAKRRHPNDWITVLYMLVNIPRTPQHFFSGEQCLCRSENPVKLLDRDGACASAVVRDRPARFFTGFWSLDRLQIWLVAVDRRRHHIDQVVED